MNFLFGNFFAYAPYFTILEMFKKKYFSLASLSPDVGIYAFYDCYYNSTQIQLDDKLRNFKLESLHCGPWGIVPLVSRPIIIIS